MLKHSHMLIPSCGRRATAKPPFHASVMLASSTLICHTKNIFWLPPVRYRITHRLSGRTRVTSSAQTPNQYLQSNRGWGWRFKPTMQANVPYARVLRFTIPTVVSSLLTSHSTHTRFITNIYSCIYIYIQCVFLHQNNWNWVPSVSALSQSTALRVFT